MHIQIGFDIELTITSPMAFIYLLHVHPSRSGDLWAFTGADIDSLASCGEKTVPW